MPSNHGNRLKVVFCVFLPCSKLVNSSKAALKAPRRGLLADAGYSVALFNLAKESLDEGVPIFVRQLVGPQIEFPAKKKKRPIWSDLKAGQRCSVLRVRHPFKKKPGGAFFELLRFCWIKGKPKGNRKPCWGSPKKRTHQKPKTSALPFLVAGLSYRLGNEVTESPLSAQPTTQVSTFTLV